MTVMYLKILNNISSLTGLDMLMIHNIYEYSIPTGFE
jgi:hypothetical protein